MSRLTQSAAYQALSAHYGQVKHLHMRDLFARDPQRFDRFSLRLGSLLFDRLRLGSLLFDFSKNRITQETLGLLLGLAEQADVAGWRDRMFSGEKINLTEGRAVLHIALRDLL